MDKKQQIAQFVAEKKETNPLRKIGCSSYAVASKFIKDLIRETKNIDEVSIQERWVRFEEDSDGFIPEAESYGITVTFKYYANCKPDKLALSKLLKKYAKDTNPWQTL